MTDTTQPGAADAAPETTTETTAPVEQQSTATATAEPEKPADQPQAETTPEDAAAPEDESDPATEATPKKKGGGFQTRIDKLTREKYEAELRAQAAERKLAEATRTESLDAEPGAEPALQEFDTVEAFTRAHAEWAKRVGYQQFRKEAEERQHHQARLTAQAALAARVDESRKKHADYDTVVAPISDFVDRHPVLSEYVLHSDMAAEVGYHLGKNPGVLLDLAKLPPFQLHRELAKLEARLSAAPPPKPVTKAPDPIKPVGSSEKAPVSLETADMDEFVRRRNDEERKARKG